MDEQNQYDSWQSSDGHYSNWKDIDRNSDSNNNPIKKKIAPPPAIDSDDAMVLKMLVAIGLITEEKVQATREIAKKLRV